MDGTDRFVYPVTVDSSNNVIRITETNGVTPVTRSVTLTAGDYYCLVNTPPAGYSSLFAHITAQLNTSSTYGATYTVALEDPAVSSLGKKSGLKISATGGTQTNFTLRFSDGLFTAPKNLFGFSVDEASDKAATANVLVGDMTAWGFFTAPRTASSKNYAMVFDQRRSRGRLNSQVQNRSYTHNMRTFKYQHIMGAFVSRWRGRYEGWAANAGLMQGDDNNAFWDVWRYGFAENKPVFVIHDDGDTNTDINSAYGYEIVKMEDEKGRDSFDALRRLTRSGGEFYDLEFTVEIIGGEYKF